MASKIRWKEDEELPLIAARFHELKAKHSGLHPISDLEFLREAQQVLPQNRRRRIAGRADAARAIGWIKRHPTIPPPPKEEPPSPPPEPEITMEAVIRVMTPLLEVAATIFAKSIAKEMSGSIREAVREGMTGALDETPEDVIQLPPEARKRIPRVALFGLLDDQHGILKKDYQGAVDLRCFGGSDKISASLNIRDKIKDMDLVIVMVNKIKHTDYVRVKKYAKRLVQLWGGAASVRDFLDDLLLKEKEKSP